MTLPPVAHPDDLTTAWLDAALGWGHVGSYTVDRIGTGQVSDSYRVSLSYGEPDQGASSALAPIGGAPTSIVLKLPASDPSSRASGASLGLYERECRFYA